MNSISPMLLCDFYKISHREQYPEKTEVVYSTWTPRASRIPEIGEVVAFGFQAFIQKYLVSYFREHFFSKPKYEVLHEYRRIIRASLGVENPHTKHIEELHDLGHLPLLIKAVPEGTLVPLRVPMLTIQNTDPRFFWLTNYIETLASSELWGPSTSATIANQYRRILDNYAKTTGGALGFVPFQGHDFSMRGMSSVESGMASGAGHLLSFVGTDTIPAILFAEKYYDADINAGMIGTSIPATEHSVMCAYGQNEIAAYRRLITEVYPSGFVSIVSDTWDLWGVMRNVIAPLKEDILKRPGKVVIRPDSGDPVKIICGDPLGDCKEACDGMIQTLWNIFGGQTNAAGYRELDPHIGCIYGDSITLDRAREISQRLKDKGFASTNMVYGIGSFTYQYNTRDTFGFALKSTLARINGEDRKIFKNPKTDDGTKKSQRGKVAVHYNSDGRLIYTDGHMLNDKTNCIMQTIFENGVQYNKTTFDQIRKRLASARPT